MAPRNNSRFMFSLGLTDAQGRLYLSDRDPYRYQAFEDNRQHTVKDGETLGGLAARYFAPIDDAALLWWVIADFQPDPIIDPTLLLDTGRVLIIPSVQVLQQQILSPARAQKPS